jgi:hypothetical protein
MSQVCKSWSGLLQRRKFQPPWQRLSQLLSPTNFSGSARASYSALGQSNPRNPFQRSQRLFGHQLMALVSLSTQKFRSLADHRPRRQKAPHWLHFAMGFLPQSLEQPPLVHHSNFSFLAVRQTTLQISRQRPGPSNRRQHPKPP